MKIFVVILKVIMIGGLLLLLIGSGACVLIDVSILLEEVGKDLDGSGLLGMLAITAGAAFLAFLAGYGMVAISRSLGWGPTNHGRIDAKRDSGIGE